MIDSKPESMNPITPIASSLAPLRPPGLAIPPRLGYAHQPVSFKAYPEAKPRKRPLSEDEIVPAVRVVLPAIKQPSGERIPAVFHAVKASVTAKEALAMSSEKFTFKVLYTLQPILALGFLATAIADVIQADLAVVDAVVFSLASGFTALGQFPTQVVA